MTSEMKREELRRRAAGLFGARGRGVWTGVFSLLLLGIGAVARVNAQAPGSVPGAPGSVPVTPNGGTPDYRYQSGLRTTTPGRAVGQNALPRGPYGQMNFGRGRFNQFSDDFDGFDGDASLDPQWSGLIEQNFQIMRRTSPFPNRFAGGIYNPRPFSRRFGPRGGGFYYPSFGTFDYGGYAFGYAPSLYGSYVPSVYSTYGSWYPPYLPVDRVYIIERDVVRDQPTTEDRRADEGVKADNAKSRGSDDTEYYLSPRSGETVADAVAEISHAWMNGDYSRLKARIRSTGKVRIYLKGKYKYAVDSADFAQMSRDAMTRIDTISFTLDRVQRQGDDHVFASGKHVYDDPDRQKREVYVSYGLVKEDGRWKIAEAGSSTEPITSHSD